MSSSSPPVLPDFGKTRPPDVDSSDTPYSHAATISTSSLLANDEEVMAGTRVGSEATSVVTPAVSEADFCKSLRYTKA
jgi:hypothetical protein